MWHMVTVLFQIQNWDSWSEKGFIDLIAKSYQKRKEEKKKKKIYIYGEREK